MFRVFGKETESDGLAGITNRCFCPWLDGWAGGMYQLMPQRNRHKIIRAQFEGSRSADTVAEY